MTMKLRMWSSVFVLLITTLLAQAAGAAEWHSFQSCNYRDHYIRHRDFAVEISDDSTLLGRKDQTFRVVPGLADAREISFESVNFPGHYLRHQNFKMRLAKFENNDQFKADATFIEGPGRDPCLTGRKSYEAYNVPGHFLRHKNFKVFIEKFDGNMNDNTEEAKLYRMDTTFYKVDPRYYDPGMEMTRSLESYNYRTYYICHRNFLGELTTVSSTLDNKDATFKMVPGLANNRYLSFESVNYPGYYLRHHGENSRIALQENDGSVPFKNQATFIEKPGLADVNWVAFEAYEHTGYYIRHKNFQLHLETGSDPLFAEDSTFRIVDPLFWATE